MRDDRIQQIAETMGLTPSRRGAAFYHASDGRWWLVGCLEGDQPLPQTGACRSAEEAIGAMEAWLGVKPNQD